MVTAAANRPVYEAGIPSTSQLIDELYLLDCEAYGRHAVDRSVLVRWVEQCPRSISLLSHDGVIVGAYGLLAVSQQQIRAFIDGKLSESDFDALPDNVTGHQYWYWSGIVVRSGYRRNAKSPLKSLLMSGIDGWLSSDRPAPGNDRLAEGPYVYALGCSDDGIALLNRFRFEKIRENHEMADIAPLYVRKIPPLFQARIELRQALNA